MGQRSYGSLRDTGIVVATEREDELDVAVVAQTLEQPESRPADFRATIAEAVSQFVSQVLRDRVDNFEDAEALLGDDFGDQRPLELGSGPPPNLSEQAGGELPRSEVLLGLDYLHEKRDTRLAQATDDQGGFPVPLGLAGLEVIFQKLLSGGIERAVQQSGQTLVAARLLVEELTLAGLDAEQNPACHLIVRELHGAGGHAVEHGGKLL